MQTKTTISEKEAAGYFWRLLELNVIPMVVWDSTGKVYCANDCFYDLLGYSKESFDRGEVTWRSITPEAEGYEELDARCIHELETDTIARPFDKVYIAKDGSHVPVRLYNAVNNVGDEKGVGIILPL